MHGDVLAASKWNYHTYERLALVFTMCLQCDKDELRPRGKKGREGGNMYVRYK